MTLTFPKGFLWGTSSAAHQVEGDNRNSDWWDWEQQPGRIAQGDTSAVACDHYHRYREDFALLRELNQNAHRLSIEWARIEPSEGVFDSRQIRHYRDVLGELREQGIAPMVTLHHFTNPMGFSRKGGWTARGAAPPPSRGAPATAGRPPTSATGTTRSSVDSPRHARY